MNPAEMTCLKKMNEVGKSKTVMMSHWRRAVTRPKGRNECIIPSEVYLSGGSCLSVKETIKALHSLTDKGLTELVWGSAGFWCIKNK